MSKMSPYSKERYNPILAHCSSLFLRFDGKKLLMSGGKKNHEYPAVSGKPDAEGGFDYSISGQKEKNKGPIPEGKYWLNPSELWENAWYKRAPLAAWGKYRITIHPRLMTKTYGRGGFFIHGGLRPGSIGCIDLTSKMNEFAHTLVREAGLRECHIPLIVDYP